MLKHIKPGKPQPVGDHCPPLLIGPLLDPEQSDTPLETRVQSVVASLGFKSFMYGMSTSPQPDRDSRSYVWTTLPNEWVALYDQNAYIEIDPRLTHCWQRVTPFIWDRHCGSDDARVAAFLDHAAEYGVGSGVVVPLRDPLHPLVLVALNSVNRDITTARRLEIEFKLGDIVLLASHFHELFMTNFVDSSAPPRQEGTILSQREIQCLELAAHGQTSADIAIKLGLVERTVNFHFGNIISKMAVANRSEAVAVAIRRGVLKS